MPTAICPECDEEVYVEADAEQGDKANCEECGSDLLVVGLDPIELDLKTDLEDDELKDEDEDYDPYD